MFQNFNQKIHTDDRQMDIRAGAKCNHRNPSQFTSRLPPPHGGTLSSPQVRPGDSAGLPGDSGQGREASGPTSIPFCKATLNPGVAGSEDTSGRRGGRRALQREVSAVVPGFPGSAIVSGQSSLQVGHGHGLFEVNDGIGI